MSLAVGSVYNMARSAIVLSLLASDDEKLLPTVNHDDFLEHLPKQTR
jgi:hypothetical protein